MSAPLKFNLPMPQILPEVLAILRDGTLAGKKLKITDRPLERELYEQVAEVVKRLGGKWKGGRTQAFVFELDPSEMWAITLESGEMPPDNPLDYFSSTPVVAKRALELIQHHDIKNILEPSAGTGTLCKAARELFPSAKIQAVEFDEYRARHLVSLGFQVHQGDFIAWAEANAGLKFDLIIMNPPFNCGAVKHAYIDHISAALSLLAPDGLLISVVPAGMEFQSTKRVKQFREFVEQSGGWRKLPQDAFKDSGTMTGTLIAWINGPERPAQFRPDPPPDPEPELPPEPEYPPLNELLDELERLDAECRQSMLELKAMLMETGCFDLINAADELVDDSVSTSNLLSHLRDLESPADMVAAAETFAELMPELTEPVDSSNEASEVIAAIESEFRFEPIKLKLKQKTKLKPEEIEGVSQGCLF